MSNEIQPNNPTSNNESNKAGSNNDGANNPTSNKAGSNKAGANNAGSKPANEAGANKLPNNARSGKAGANKLPGKALSSRPGFGIIVKTVAFLYLTWAGVVVCDLALCRVNEYRTNKPQLNRSNSEPQLNNAGRNDVCDAQVREVGGVFTTVTVGLMGWLSDGPSNRI